MGWGPYRHRPIGTGTLRSHNRWHRGRMIVLNHSCPITNYLQAYKVFAAGDVYAEVARLADVRQRVYLKANDYTQEWQRTVRVEANLCVSDSLDGPWTKVAEATNFGFNLGLPTPYERFAPPEEWQGNDFLSIETIIWQYPGDWIGPFEVMHELWANGYVFHRSGTTPQNIAASVDRSHYFHDGGSRRKPRWAGG